MAKILVIYYSLYRYIAKLSEEIFNGLKKNDVASEAH